MIQNAHSTSLAVLLFCLGFVWDRHWVVVNSKGRGFTQRVEPKLALIQVELPTEAFSLGWVPTKSSYMGKYVILLTPNVIFNT